MYEYNVASTGISDGRLLEFLRGPQNEIIAGLYGWTLGGCCEVKTLWVHAGWRGKGLGTRLMTAAEQEARRRGAAQIVLNTHSFQAPRFYERLGFERVGYNQDYPVGQPAHLSSETVGVKGATGMGDEGAKNKAGKAKHKKNKLHSKEEYRLKKGHKKKENEQEYLPGIAMSIHAHPDDQEFTVAGTLAKWARNGCRVISVIVTSGDAGSNDPSKNADYKARLALLREDEQIAANLLLGIRETAFLHYPDGELEATLQLRKDLTRLIRVYKPDVVVTGDPTRVLYGSDYINHPDHRAAAEAAVYAVFPSSGTRLIFTELLEEGYEPFNVRKLYLSGADEPDVWVDIHETLDLKIAALKEHASQLGEWDPTDMLREWAADTGKEQGMKFAESFKVMSLVEDKPES